MSDPFDGDFNPPHIHFGCHISTVGFLKLPSDIEEYGKKKIKIIVLWGDIPISDMDDWVEL